MLPVAAARLPATLALPLPRFPRGLTTRILLSLSRLRLRYPLHPLPPPCHQLPRRPCVRPPRHHPEQIKQVSAKKRTARVRP